MGNRLSNIICPRRSPSLVRNQPAKPQRTRPRESLIPSNRWYKSPRIQGDSDIRKYRKRNYKTIDIVKTYVPSIQRLKKINKLKSIKKLKCLNDNNNQSPRAANILMILLQMKQIKQLSFDFEKIKWKSNRWFIGLKHYIDQFHRLESFEVNLENSMLKNNYPASTVLLNSIRKIRGLKSLSIKFQKIKQPIQFAEKEIKLFSNCLKNATDIRELEFAISLWKNLNPKHVKTLTSSLHQQPNLERLKVELRFNNSINYQSQELFAGLSHFSNLLFFSGYFKDCLQLEEYTCKSFFHYIKNLKKLVFLELRLIGPNNRVSNESLMWLANSIAGLNSLETLIIQFKKFESICGNGVESIFSCFQRLPRIKRVELLFPEALIPNSCLASFINPGVSLLTSSSDKLLNIQNLQCLKLNLKGAFQAKDGIFKLSELFPQLKNLTELSLNLHSCQCGDKGLITFSKAITELDNLQVFDFNFSRKSTGIDKITNIGFIALCKSLKNMKCLEKFSLSFKRRSNLMDEGLLAGTLYLQEIVNLKHLKLVFRWCPNITDQSLIAFRDRFSRYNTELENFHLDVRGCLQITRVMLNSLENALAFCRPEILP